MKQIKDYKELAKDISSWIKEYAENAGLPNLICGVSGGIDSSVVSTLCAMTGLPTYCCSIAINSKSEHLEIASKHLKWLQTNFENVTKFNFVLDDVLHLLLHNIGKGNSLTTANTKSRLRMVTLYHTASINKGLVIGTGSYSEDYCAKFFSKFGDGGVDMNPLGSLYKSQVYGLGKELGIIEEVMKAAPTDGLHEDGRTDVDQLKITYDEIEWANEYFENMKNKPLNFGELGSLDGHEMNVLERYTELFHQGAHKVKMPPVFELTKNYE